MHAIKTSCTCKAEVVELDEREGGLRAILNLGHTFGHAIETYEGYGAWLHGEAVAAGMVMAAELSCLEGLLTSQDVERIRALLIASDLPIQGPEGMLVQEYQSLMSVDKKVLDGTLRLVLMRSIGEAFVSSEFSSENLKTVLSK
jgi:3-dehydroquinate synthase